ncbi:MAG: MgtC/SapB family protein [Acetobacteraceae bacterium]|nr:MgtC/SapB family protein [Acetobacteraceae bacterium]
MGALEVVGRLALAAVLGGMVGLERESVRRPAGLRTHILVCVGSALIMLVSLDVYRLYRGVAGVDPGRIAAQVVSGIGFLGAGTIMREGASIRGLTTAATLWVVAGVGLAAGAGLLWPAAASTVLVMAVLVLVPRLERAVFRPRLHHLTLWVADRPGQLGQIGTVLGSRGVDIKGVTMRPADDPETVELELDLRLPNGYEAAHLARDLLGQDGVYRLQQ